MSNFPGRQQSLEDSPGRAFWRFNERKAARSHDQSRLSEYLLTSDCLCQAGSRRNSTPCSNSCFAGSYFAASREGIRSLTS